MSAAFFMGAMAEPRREAVAAFVAAKFFSLRDLTGTKRHRTSFHIIPLVFASIVTRFRRLEHAAISAGSSVAAFPEAAAGSAALFQISPSSQACEPPPLERRGSLLHRHGAEPILEGL